ncbi:mannitol-1-phosphate 5-dehydrogenase [Amphibacillus marinus]|uniref:Mannitol-1-phosphate 5-dehydrogenase n=1 Tax=Amphibacillus marinus TaxID=872970 RepID=A0A1H8T739_9BACI|nr:mannitol dehydrogenase [Amphibacillus marinus]SEO86645.1 mannitol-1-phosphate 5-dehydrogenase [Amphibacillus marinus]
MKNVLIVGAGRLGKGFVGETFFNAGWNISFLDKDPKVIKELLKNGNYKVRVHKTDTVVDNVISGYQAFTTDKQHSVSEAFLSSDLLMLPLYPEDFKEAAHYLGELFEQQFKQNPNSKKTLICLTNKNHIIPEITAYFRDNLTNQETKDWFDSHVAIRDSIVRRSTDAETNYSTNLVTTAVASLIIQEPVYSDFSDVQWLDVRKNVAMLKDIKVFTINGPHAATAYYGYLKGFDDIPTAAQEEDIAALIKGVHDATVQAVLKEYPVTRDEIRELEYLPEAKNEMPDTIFRVGYDPIRKVGPKDRFMGVVALCEKYDINYDAITKAIACAFAYTEPQDANAIKLQDDIEQNGLQNTVASHIGRDQNSEVVAKIVDEYNKLAQLGLIG